MVGGTDHYPQADPGGPGPAVGTHQGMDTGRGAVRGPGNVHNQQLFTTVDGPEQLFTDLVGVSDTALDKVAVTVR